MKKVLPALTLLLFCALKSLSQSAAVTPTPTPKPPDNEDVVKISTALVQVDVTVTDKNGKIVKDLNPDDFEVYENGVKQNITNLSFISAESEQNQKITKFDKNDKLAVPIPPTNLRPEQVRRTIALVVDDLSLSFESTHFVRLALRKFVEEQMQDGDLVAIVRTGAGSGALQQFTSDKRQLLAAIDKIKWNSIGSGGVGAFAAIEATPLEQAKANGADISDDQLAAEKNFNRGANDFRQDIFATGTLGAINYVVRGMKELPGRKSIMLLSDGFKLFSQDKDGFKDSTRVLDSLRQLVDLANRASVVVYTMDARGLQTLGLTAEDNTSSLSATDIEGRLSDRRDELLDTQDGLVYLAKQTGGFPIINNNDLSGGIRKILDDQSYYLIGYEPDTDTFDPKTRRFNKLEVKVKRKNTDVRYRSGFFGVTDEQFKKPTNLSPEQQILTALSSPFAVNDINLSLNTIFKSDAKQAASVSSFVYINAKDLKFTDEPTGKKKAVFDVLAVSYGTGGVPVDQLSKTYTLTLDAENYQKIIKDGFVYYFTFPIKKAGAYQMRVAVRDHNGEKVGSASQFIEVPNIKNNRLTLSGMVLENLTVEQWSKESGQSAADRDKTASGVDPLLSTSLRQFKRGTILRYGFEIYNAKQPPQLQTQTRMFHDGKLLFEGKQIPVSLTGQTNLQIIQYSGAINLGTEIPTGDYILQIVTTDNSAKEKNKVAAQFVQFEVVP